jgi:hypothetical protein
MKLTLSVTPKFVQATRFCRLFRISGITLLWWVLHIFPIAEHTYEFKLHERIHSNQQTFLFLLGLLACAATSFILGVFDVVTPWWVWTFPVTVPFILYVLLWLVEVILPPYDRAYRDSIFEREAYLNQESHDYVPTIFSVWKYFRGNRKFLEQKRK